MKTLWLLLLGMSWCVGGSPLLAQDLTHGGWAVDFRPRWPAEQGFKDCYFANGTDALARGYFLDPRSISPDRQYGVIVPRFGVVLDGANFLVELDSHRIVGLLGGPGFAFPAKAEVGWAYHWAPDNASLVIEQAGSLHHGWSRVGWRLVELRNGFILRDTDLLKTPSKVPGWLDKKQGPTHERSEPVADVSPAVLAESSAGEGAWSVQRDAGAGPLQMVKGGARAGTLPVVRAIGADAKGAVHELSSDELPGLPLCFFSLDEKWLFVNQLARVDPETGQQWRTAAIYWRNDADDGKTATWKIPSSENLNDSAWESFARHNQLPPETVAPPDATGFRDRTIEFVNWSRGSSRALVYLRARNGTVTSKDGKPAYYRWYCYFDTTKLSFETSFELDPTNRALQTRWKSNDESLDPSKILLRVGDPGGATLFAPYSDVDSFADNALNKNYKALLGRLDKDAVEETRQEQRDWLAYRDTLAKVHALNRWSVSFADEVLHEGRFLATNLRAEDLKEQAIAAQPADNKVLREKSPDGKYGISYTYADDDATHERTPVGVELVELPSQRTVLDLYDEMTNRALEGHWSPDSKYLAFHFGSHRVSGITIYERQGAEFAELSMPDLDRFAPQKKKGEHSYHFDGSDLTLIRWLGPKKLLTHYVDEFDVEDEAGHQRTIEADHDLVLSIEKRKVIIEKATKTKSDN